MADTGAAYASILLFVGGAVGLWVMTGVAAVMSSTAELTSQQAPRSQDLFDDDSADEGADAVDVRGAELVI